MEITIDLALVRKLVKDEYVTARAEIAQYGPAGAYARSQQRHDARLSEAPDAATLACRAGCSWCCHFTVDIRAVEALRIVDFMTSALGPEEQARIRHEVRANSESLRGIDDVGRMQRNIRCPFLKDAQCQIYEARPQTCRNYHATNAAGCQKSFEEPDNLDIDPDFAALTYQTGGAHVDGFSMAMRDAGYDVAAYEMNIALEAALSEPQFRARFEMHADPILQGAEVPLEFADPEEE